ncbi:MAG: VWA domain-containing protein [Planctomycetaceae bacterium]|nr:VWA domain-containing protein [Planctomycetaceae bacterium]
MQNSPPSPEFSGVARPDRQRREPRALGQWLQLTLRRVMLPSWVLSVLLHGLLGTAFVGLSQSPGCRGDFSGEEGAEFRVVGIRSKDDSPPTTPPTEATHESDPTPVPPTEVVTPPIPNQPPVPLTLPKPLQNTPPVIGAAAPPTFDATQFSQVIQARPRATPATTGTGTNTQATGQRTSFLGVSDVGRAFVYVIDRSASMQDDGRLRAAKTDLLASLQQLDESQQFQIVFYNEQPTVLIPRNSLFSMFHGTDAQRRLVSDQLRSVVPDGGTGHFLALKKALEFKADVIFLLTDGAAESALSAREMDEIRRRNGGGTRIHCIEFGKGTRSPNGSSAASGNYLDQLARDNGGTYVYKDVNSLGRE